MYEGLIDSLKEWGCDTTGAMERMLDDVEFFMECLTDYCQSDMVGSLHGFITDRNSKDGDDMAHAIKGLAANLGLDRISELSRDIMHQLRESNFSAAEQTFVCLETQQRELETIINRYKKHSN